MSDKIIVKRLDTVSVVNGGKKTDYVLPIHKSGEYVVDDSNFCPMSEAVKQLSRTAPISSDEVKMYFDFPDGKDTGMKVPVQRSGHFSDITELSQDITEQQQAVAEVIDDVKKKAAEKAETKAAIQAAISASSSGSSAQATE